MSNNSKVQPLAETALAVALALVISLIHFDIAQTFYLELASIPLMLVGLRHGWRYGVSAGLIYGLLQVVLGQASILTPLQGLLEYLLAPVSLGLTGLFRADSISVKRLTSAVSCAIGVKYFWHFLAGIVFWGQYAWAGWRTGGKLVLYSLIANGVSAVITVLAAIAILFLIRKTTKIL